MGGNALKIAKTRRYSKKEYEEISREFIDTLPFKIYIPKSFGNKDSFGDLDILVHSGSYNNIVGDKSMYDFIKETFNPTEIYNNSNVVSFDYKEFQIDFIRVKDINWETSKRYFEYNDLGNLIGRICYQMGFRYGHFGLKLVYRHDDGGKKFEKIISKDMDMILDFLGFDAERYRKGFESLTDVFDYVLDSKYFDPKYFAYEALNHQNRTRNKKRKNYAEFLNYIKDKKFDNKVPLRADKDYYVKKAEEYFGINLVSLIEVWNREVELDKIVSIKFNGYVIMEEYPNLRGKELGDAIRTFKDYVKSYLGAKAALEKDDTDVKMLHRNWIIESDVEHIMSIFKTVNNLK
jgi:hypothetical protein